jgi:hypothetical protein
MRTKPSTSEIPFSPVAKGLFLLLTSPPTPRMVILATGSNSVEMRFGSGFGSASNPLLGIANLDISRVVRSGTGSCWAAASAGSISCCRHGARRRSAVSLHPMRVDRTSSGSQVARAGGAGYSADWWTPTAFSALLREELERLLDELLVVLEDSAVAGVRVDHQLVVRQTSGHVEGVRRRQHPVVVAVGEEHGLADA